MKTLKRFLNEILITGLSGMALGLFATLIIGTIVGQVGTLIGGSLGSYIIGVGNFAKTIMGAGIGVGVAYKLKASPLVAISAGVVGMIGAFPFVNEITSLNLGTPGEPLGAFCAVVVGIKVGMLVSGKTKLDIIITPLCSIFGGALVGILVGPYISSAMKALGQLVNVNVEQYPILGGALISVLMGMILTLPISSAALGISMSISGVAAGAATIGCCCNMVGFAVISYRENKMGGLLAQGIGTSMLQVANIVRKPVIWIPSILSSAILGAIGAAVFRLPSTPIGSGMGSAGFVGQIAAYGAMIESGMGKVETIGLIMLMHFILPAIVTLGIALVMRKMKLIKNGDMKLDL